MSKSKIYTPSEFNSMVVYTNTPANGEEIVLLKNAPVSFASKSLHYGAVNFEGAKVVVHPSENGKHRLYILHYDWNAARLNFGIESWGYGKSPMTVEQHMLSLVNILYANGWDAKPVVSLEGSRTPCSDMYVRSLAYLGEANDIRLRNNQPFGVGLIVSPQLSYHVPGSQPGMAVLHIPEPRNLAAPHQKRADNYPNSMKWVRIMEKFLEWVVRENPKIFVDGKEAVGETKTKAVLFLSQNLKEILFHNRDGAITEGSAENVGIVKKDVMKTPPIEAGALPGFTMQKAELAADFHGLAVKRKPFGLQELLKADLAFMTGNAAGAVPINAVVKCGWTQHDDLNYSFHGPVRIAMVGNPIGMGHHQNIKKELDAMLAGKSPLGKFGLYADEFVSKNDVKEIREKTADMMHEQGKRLKTGLAGQAPENFRTTTAKPIMYAKMLKIR